MSIQEPGQWNQDLTSDGDYLEINPEIPPSQQFSQFEIDNRPPSKTLTQLNQSLEDHEETVIATSAPSFRPSSTLISYPTPGSTIGFVC